PPERAGGTRGKSGATAASLTAGRGRRGRPRGAQARREAARQDERVIDSPGSTPGLVISVGSTPVAVVSTLTGAGSSVPGHRPRAAAHVIPPARTAGTPGSMYAASLGRGPIARAIGV